MTGDMERDTSMLDLARTASGWCECKKLGAGYQTLFLYRLIGHEFSSATSKPLGDLAWDYFFGLPVSKKLHRDPKERDSLNHVQAVLIQGLENDYAWMTQHWPDSRYLVISLSFDAQGEDKPAPWIEAWRCVYDLKTGEFSGHRRNARPRSTGRACLDRKSIRLNSSHRCNSYAGFCLK